MTAPTLDAIRALNGRNFAMLTAGELEVFRFYRDRGRKFGVVVTVTSDAADPKALEGASLEQAEEIMRRANGHVRVTVADGGQPEPAAV